ncbi:PREDICTED: uncharacterized protein At1g76660 [Nelumbo nucifera]|uniref:Uncharacterized protein At1g76660 n=1 Tax=Nelumbo nucifera TaxID=4432 RepID=A0A1U8ATA1_NELNU|nr:PREDICTED: uncharacterized protein At1g76660 [Nelumbo nucifera]
MAGNGNGNGNGGASLSAAATAIGSAETRFQREERRRCGSCWGRLSCFGSQKGGKRIVPASRIPDGNTSSNRTNGPQPVGVTNQTTTITPSLLAPPSSPASFTNSALPSTAQSPNCFLSLSANSPGGPSSTMFATGPYAHETQLVSPPVFSTFTTEPSTAPLTPPPELAHLTTPSSPDVPFAQFLSSSVDLKSAGKSSYSASSDLQATYPLYPGSPASSLISPISGTSGDGLSSSFADQEFPTQWGAPFSVQDSQYPQSGSSRLFGLGAAPSKNFMLSQDSSFFCPATSAQFYLDQAQQSIPSYPHCGGRLSLSREADVYSSTGNHQNRHAKNCKSDTEEIEAYRASFGFSADEIITTPQYVEISDIMDDSFTIAPFASHKSYMEESMAPELTNGVEKMQSKCTNALDRSISKWTQEEVNGGVDGQVLDNSSGHQDDKQKQLQSVDISGQSKPVNHAYTDEDIFSKMEDSKISRRYRLGLSSSDAEIDYGRGRSFRIRQGDFNW